jgi:hypothetical protein
MISVKFNKGKKMTFAEAKLKEKKNERTSDGTV